MVKTPCIAACKNNSGICSGCQRTIREIIDWKNMDDQKREQIMAELVGNTQTHTCPSCGGGAHCDLAAGKDHCWCFELDEREPFDAKNQDLCLCRSCLSKQALA